MAVQILNDMPDAAVHRGDPVPSPTPSLNDWSPRTTRTATRGNRPLFVAITAGLHLVAVLGFLSIRHVNRSEAAPTPIEVSLIDVYSQVDEAAPLAQPQLQNVVYTLTAPEPLSFDSDSVNAPQLTTQTPTPAAAPTAVAPMVESVEYVRAPAPVYPRESSRRREYGTVLLRVLVDPAGRPSQIEVERSSGYERLDMAARSAVEKALFRPYEVNGIAQAAQVLIPIEFARRTS